MARHQRKIQEGYRAIVEQVFHVIAAPSATSNQHQLYNAINVPASFRDNIILKSDQQTCSGERIGPPSCLLGETILILRK